MHRFQKQIHIFYNCTYHYFKFNKMIFKMIKHKTKYQQNSIKKKPDKNFLIEIFFFLWLTWALIFHKIVLSVKLVSALISYMWLMKASLILSIKSEIVKLKVFLALLYIYKHNFCIYYKRSQILSNVSKIKLFIYFITLQLFQHDMYNVTLCKKLQKINKKGSERKRK